MIVGINGFGRIGKMVFKVLVERGVEVALVNDPFVTLEYMLYLLKYDSVFGKNTEFRIESDKLCYNKQQTSLSNFTAPKDIPWKEYGVEYVVEATGIFTTVEKCGEHQNVRAVVITAPSEDAPTFVFGVNHHRYESQKVISNASCTTNCLAPLAKIINDRFHITEGLMTTVHSVTATQKIVDGMGKKRRSARSALVNIIPATTGAAKALGKVIPELSGKMNGMAVRVPTPNVSVVDLVCRVEKPATMEEILGAVREYDSMYPGIMGVVDEDVVSSDFIGDSRSSILDVRASIILSPNFMKLISWYDNEYGYSCRMYDLLKHVSESQK
jgi:glyceraldehyde 3-phosphate dehydrogenase